MIPDDVTRRWRASGAWGEETLPQRFARVCAAEGARKALIDGGVRLSFAEVAERAERLASHLVARGVRPGDVVSWQLPNWWEAAVVHHAALRAGAVPNPLNPAFGARELAFVTAQAQPKVLVVPAEWRGSRGADAARSLGVPEVLVARGGSLDEALATPGAAPLPAMPADPGAIALLLYTSGTTSDPKGVQLTHRALLCEIDSFRDIHRLGPEDRNLGGAPVAHIAGLVYGLLVPFALGTSTALLERWDAAAALDLIARERATFMTGPPTFLQTLAAAHEAAPREVSSFRLFSTGGANIPTEAVRAAGARLGCVVKRAYGSTEVPTLTATRFDDDPEIRIGTDGRAIGEAQIRIVDADGNDVAPGAEGEIWARAPEMLAGYRDPALDAEAFAPGGWFRTGDLGTLDAAGNLRVTGRRKDIIIRGGENISAKELEDLLAAHPAIADAAVIGVPDARLGERVCAVLVLRPGATLTFDEMVASLRARGIATHKLPERMVLRDTLPRTESGKVRKDALRAAVTEPA